MPTLIFGVVVLVLVLWALNIISKVDPKIAARVMKLGGGLLSLGFAVFLGLRGELGIAIPLGAFGLGLLGWLPFGPAGFTARTQKTGGQTSRVRSAFYEMELDHDTGAMRGRVLAGRYQGVDLGTLDVETLVSMLAQVDEESRALLMAYLDRRDPDGVRTRRRMRQSGRVRRVPAKCRNRRPIRSLACRPARPPTTSAARIAR